MTKLERLNMEKDSLTKHLQDVQRAIEVEEGETLVACCWRDCRHEAPVNTLVYIQTHWYERPYSCTGGDRWHAGEGQFVCPMCNRIVRGYDRPEIENLKYRFKSIVNTYDK